MCCSGEQKPVQQQQQQQRHSMFMARSLSRRRCSSTAAGDLPARKFTDVESCCLDAREEQTVVSEIFGSLLRGRSTLPYFMLVAFEACGICRFALLLLFSPVYYFLNSCVSESSATRMLIFLTFAGLKVRKIESVARAILPKFFSEDVHPVAWRLFSSFGKRYVLTSAPRIMVESFARDFLGADTVIGTEIQTTKSGIATGFVKFPGVLARVDKRNALKAAWKGSNAPDVGVGVCKNDFSFLSLCKEGYVVVPTSGNSTVPKPLRREKFAKKIVFHDGRLVQRPTPFLALVILLWMPVGFFLAVLRIAVGVLPMRWARTLVTILGVRVVIKGRVPPAAAAASSKPRAVLQAEDKKNGRMIKQQQRGSGVLFVCSHRTLMDPIFLSVALGRRITAVTYSISRFSKLIAPIKTVALTRNREQDASNIRKLLAEGDLAICPEGTTCREPFLLRFSSLFAELTDQITPVAMNCRMSMFHGTTATGWKCMDPYFFFMNPRPVYEVTFLPQLPLHLTCAAGKSPHEVANCTQQLLAGTLGFECTNFTRKDKYRMLAGHDGSVVTVPAAATHAKPAPTAPAAPAAHSITLAQCDQTCRSSLVVAASCSSSQKCMLLAGAQVQQDIA